MKIHMLLENPTNFRQFVACDCHLPFIWHRVGRFFEHQAQTIATLLNECSGTLFQRICILSGDLACFQSGCEDLFSILDFEPGNQILGALKILLETSGRASDLGDCLMSSPSWTIA